jgi:hypothetical protein
VINDPRARETFGKLLRMLGSDQSGERAVAALKATQLLLAHGLDWHAVAAAVSSPVIHHHWTPPQSTPRPRARPKPANMPHNLDAATCLESPEPWKEHEATFLKQMKVLGRAPTEKQRAWLDYLLSRARAASQEAA